MRLKELTRVQVPQEPISKKERVIRELKESKQQKPVNDPP